MTLHNDTTHVIVGRTATESLPDPTGVSGRVHVLVNGTGASATWSSTGATPFRVDGILQATYVLGAGTSIQMQSDGANWVAKSSAFAPSGEFPWASVSRYSANSQGIATGNQNLRLHYFTALVSGSTTAVRIITGLTPAAATPTLIRVGLYSIDDAGNGTLIASTPNDTTLLAVADTRYTKAWSAPANLVAGQRYAFGILIVSGAAFPTLLGVTQPGNAPAFENFVLPMAAALLTAQANLPASFAVGSLVTSFNLAYVVAT